MVFSMNNCYFLENEKGVWEDFSLNYLEISRASDLRNKRDRIIYRIFEILPGFLSWSTLFLAFFLSYFAPIIVGVFIILFDLYWLFRVIYLSFHQISAFLKMRKNLKIDWLSLAKKMDGFEEIFHLICLPFYKEGSEIVEGSLNSILNSNYPKEKIMIILAVEERGGDKAKRVAEEMVEKFSKKFYKFFVSVHPKNLPGEVEGKGANVNFAIEKVKEEIKEIDPENIIFSVFDVDTKPYPNYFALVTYQYLKLKKEKNVCFQPIPVYNNNVWQAPSFSRVVATSNTFWQMMQQERPEQLVSYSSHSIPFKTLLEVSYPKNVVSDDSRIFWKLYLFKNGNFKAIPLFYPVSMDAVLGKNLWSTIVNQYKQQRRWAWGAENIPYLFFGFLKNKKISISEKIKHSFVILEGFWSWAVTALLIFLLGWLPVIIGSGKLKIEEKPESVLFGYSLPKTTRNLMTISMSGMIICAILSLLILPSPPKNYGFLKKISIILQWFFLPITLIAFGSIPALDAQTRLILGKHLKFWVTEKVRKNE
jgi:cellulose synthase/poly-beta-1,6-N-acetylglucosamine synthase-like glycosyltransferase